MQSQLQDAEARRSFLRWLLDFCFGYDFFISYAWKDGRIYAVALASVLKDRGFECFLDSKEYVKGDNWRIVGRIALRRTSRLILVGTSGALASEPVLRELERFSRLQRRIIPISFDGSLTPDDTASSPLFQFVTKDNINIPELKSQLDIGPAESTVNAIVESFNLLRQDRWRIRVLAGAAALFLAIAVVALVVGVVALVQKNRAEQRERIASSQGLAAMATSSLPLHPQRATLLSVAGLEVTERVHEPRVSIAEQALRDSLGVIGGRPLSGHTGGISQLLVSSDGKHVYTSSADATVRMWNLQQPTSPSVMLGGEKLDVLSMVLTKDGKTLVTAGRDATVKVWDTARPQSPRKMLSGHTHSVSTVALSFDERMIVSGSDDGTARAWDLHNLDAPPLVFKVDNGQISVLKAIPQSRRFVAMCSDGTGRIWNLEHPDTPPMVLNTFESRGPSVLTVSPDGKWMVSGGLDSRLRAWRLSEDIPVTPIEIGGGISRTLAIEFSPDGYQLATASEDGKILLWKADELDQYAGALPQKPEIRNGHTGSVTSLAFHPGGEYLASTGGDVKMRMFMVDGVAHRTIGTDPTVRVWYTRLPEEDSLVLRGHEGAVHAAAFASEGNRLVTGGSDGITRVWNMRPEEPINGDTFDTALSTRRGVSPVIFRAHQGNIRSAALSSDGRFLATLGFDRTIGVWKLGDEFSSPTLIKSFKMDSADKITFVGRGTDLRINTTSGLHHWNWETEPEPKSIGIPREAAQGSPNTVVSDNGAWLAIVGQVPGIILLYDMATPETRPLEISNKPGVYYPVLSYDGRYIAGLSDETNPDVSVRQLVIWDRLHPSQAPRTIPWANAASGWARIAAISSNGQLVVRTETEGFAQLLDISKADKPIELRRLDGHDGTVSTATFRQDDLMLATAGSETDRTVRLWNLARMQEESILLAQEHGEISHIEFSRNSQWLTVVYARGTIGLWHLSLQDLVKLAKNAAGRQLSDQERMKVR